MNSIDKRLERLQQSKNITSKNVIQENVGRQKRFKNLKQEFLFKQNNGCACCGWKFDNYNDKPKFDFPTKKYDNPIALLCAKCERIVDDCGRNVDILRDVIKYLNSDKETFE